jgi:ParB/RepB/Spo0J family partition protein
MQLELIPVKKIVWTELNPRRNLDISDILTSIKEKGVLQPIKVYSNGNGKFVGLLGQRRFLAAKAAGKEDIPCLVAETYTEQAEMIEEIMIENLHRRGFSEDEEIIGFETYLKLTGDATEAVDRLALRAGINPKLVRRRLAINSLPKDMKQAWRDGRLKIGHLEQLLRLDDKEQQRYWFAESLCPTYYNPSGAAMEVQRLKAKIDELSINLKIAKFKTGECNQCPANTLQCATLFGEDMVTGEETKKGSCMKRSCFAQKQLAAIREHWKEDTNRVEFVFDIAPDQYEIIVSAPKDKCVTCSDYSSLIQLGGLAHVKQACLGDKTCFRELYRKPKTKTAEDGTEQVVDVKTERAEVRSDKHSKEFRDEFYLKSFKTQMDECHKDHNAILHVLLVGLTLHDYDCRRIVAEEIFGTRTDMMNPDVMVERLLRIGPDTVIRAFFACAVNLVMRRDRNVNMPAASLYFMQTICDWLSIDIGTQWEFTDEYLNVKTKSEIIAIGNEMNLWDNPTVKAKLGEKNPDTVKKPDLIACFFLSDVTYTVPKELQAREKLVDMYQDMADKLEVK